MRSFIPRANNANSNDNIWKGYRASPTPCAPKFPKVRQLAWWGPWAGLCPKDIPMREATREKLTSDFSARQQCPGQPGQSQLSRRLETTRCQDGSTIHASTTTGERGGSCRAAWLKQPRNQHVPGVLRRQRTIDSVRVMSGTDEAWSTSAKWMLMWADQL